MSRTAELRRTLIVTGIAVRTLFAIFPFVGNLLLSLVVGGRSRRSIRALLESDEGVPVDEPPAAGTGGRVYLIAGEESGDLHAANLVSALREIAPGAEIRGLGGPRMERAGCRLDHDLVRMSVMGVLPVLRSVGTFFGLFRDFLRMLETNPPDVLVPVDYPGFNFRAARLARRRGVKVVYYIAPQVWAWAPWRLRRIARAVDRLLVILPFERPLHATAGTPVAFVGHPLYEHLERDAPADERPPPPAVPERIGLLPGSRRAEVRSLLPAMLRAARRVHEAHPGVRFVVPFRRADLLEVIESVLSEVGEGLPVDVVEGRTHETMRALDLALVASGTATLELTYYLVPMVVLYRVGRIGSALKGLLVNVPHVGLVNIVAGRRVVPEYVRAGDLGTPAAEHLLRWIGDAEEREACRDRLRGVRSRLLFTGVSRRAAGWVAAELGDAGSPPR